MYSFLMIGQSNMAGRGFEDDVTPIENKRLYVLRNGRWQPMYVPVNGDRKFSGISLTESFADMCSKYYDTDIGLIPCADGGTTLEQWKPGDMLYDHAVFQAKLAMRSSKLAGVLWHQGESDCADEKYPLYEEKCMNILASLKKDLELDDVPFLVGGLGDYLANLGGVFHNYRLINEMLQNMERNHDYIGYVPAEGLTCNPDNLHFNAPSLREFGLRYFGKFKEMNKLIEVGNHVEYDGNYTEMERL